MLDFYKGMDISFVPQVEAAGTTARDFDKTPTDMLELAARYGVNAIRLRLWNEPENVPESGGYCNLRRTVEMARRIKAQGMSFLLDFHYSDFWADPGQQRKPKAWESLHGEALENAVYSFTKQTLETLKAEGVMPDMVQIGNEIRSGLLFPDGELPDYDGMVRLVNAGIRGARAVAGKEELQIMIHLDQGGRYLILKEWFDQALAHGLEDFDMIGLSYYPFWHGTFSDLKNTMEQLISDFGKPLVVAETAHAWRRSAGGFIDEAQERIAGIPATPQGQKKVLDLVMNIVASLPDRMGLGIYYWEPFCVPKDGEGGWSENMGLLEEDGTVMEAVKSFLFTRQMASPMTPAKVYEPPEITALCGNCPAFPEELSVLYYDGTLRRHKVIWDREPKTGEEAAWREQKPGIYQFRGVICAADGTEDGGQAETAAQTAAVSDIWEVSLTVRLAERLEEGKNLIEDGNWDNGLVAWTMEKSDDRVQAFLYPEIEAPFPAPPVNTLRVEAAMNFRFALSQKITLPHSGDYRLSVFYRGVDTTGVDVRLFMQAGEECRLQIIHPTDDGWTEHVLTWKNCPTGEITVGISISSPPVYGWMKGFRLMMLTDPWQNGGGGR